MKLPPFFLSALFILSACVPSIADAATVAPTFYRGFAVEASQPPGPMGEQVLDRIVVSPSRKVRIQESFRQVLEDHGNLNEQFTPRDPQNKNVVYLGTNHFIRAEGGQTGVFTVWTYNLASGQGGRFTSFRYDPRDAAGGYAIVGNEGTKLVIMKKIDGPYCERALPDIATSHAVFQTMNMRNAAARLSAYTSSQSMKAVFARLPACQSGAGDTGGTGARDGGAAIDIQLNALNAYFPPTTTMTLIATAKTADMPANGRLIIGEQSASPANGRRLQVCEMAGSAVDTTCTASFVPERGEHFYIAIIEDQDGKYIAWKQWPKVTITPPFHF